MNVAVFYMAGIKKIKAFDMSRRSQNSYNSFIILFLLFLLDIEWCVQQSFFLMYVLNWIISMNRIPDFVGYFNWIQNKNWAWVIKIIGSISWFSTSISIVRLVFFGILSFHFNWRWCWLIKILQFNWILNGKSSQLRLNR